MILSMVIMFISNKNHLPKTSKHLQHFVAAAAGCMPV